MIFQHTLEKVLAGDKWQTRRLYVKGDTSIGHPFGGVASVFRNGRLLYQVGKTYAVQPHRGKPSVGRIRITGIRWEHVCDINIEDAIAEGFDYVEVFLTTWTKIHGRSSIYAKVWVIEFELLQEQSQ